MCYKCNNLSVVKHKMTEDKPNCKKCGGEQSVIITSAPTVTFKGDRWADKKGI